MRSIYTIRAIVTYEIEVNAGDEDEAFEKASRVKWLYWQEIPSKGSDMEIREVYPLEKEKHNASD
jgi:hypothetical protein